MPKEIEELLDQYWDRFGEGFPLYQTSEDWEDIKKDILACLEDNLTANNLNPDKYGACAGKEF